MFLASASTTIKFHEFSTGHIVHHYQPGSKVEGPVRSISWSRDGSWLILVPQSGPAELLSIREHLTLLRTIPDVDKPFCASFPNTTKKSVSLGTTSGLVLVYDIKKKNIQKRFQKCSDQVTHLEYTANDQHIIAGCNNGEVFIFNNSTNSPPTMMKIPKSCSLTDLKSSRNKRNLVLAGSNEGIVVLWDINVNKPKFLISAHEAPVNSLAFSPLNNDVIVSTGSDRQFSFFDVAEKKCIAKVIVENNMTAVDFSADGRSFVMASQKGHIHVYDTRNIQTPIRSFEAHKSTIKHIAFQKASDSVKHSTSSLSSECFTPQAANEVPSRSNRCSDLFGMFAQTTNTPTEQKKSALSTEADSFLAALGLDENNTGASSGNDGDDLFVQESIDVGDNDQAANEQKSAQDKSFFKELKTYSSTPNTCKLPIPAQHFFTPGEAANADIPELISLKEELTSDMREMKKQIEFQVLDARHELKMLLFDLRMLIVRESIKTEDLLSEIQNDLRNDPAGVMENRRLIEENEQLRFRITFLEEQLRNLRN